MHPIEVHEPPRPVPLEAEEPSKLLSDDQTSHPTPKGESGHRAKENPVLEFGTLSFRS